MLLRLRRPIRLGQHASVIEAERSIGGAEPLRFLKGAQRMGEPVLGHHERAEQAKQHPHIWPGVDRGHQLALRLLRLPDLLQEEREGGAYSSLAGRRLRCLG